MKYLKTFENQSLEKSWIDFYKENPDNYLPQTITWIRKTFFNKIDFVKKNMEEFEDRIDGVFNKNSGGNFMKIGIGSDYSTEAFFREVFNLIINQDMPGHEGDKPFIKSMIESSYSEKRFHEILEIIRTRKMSKFSDTVYYPYYGYERNFSVDRDVFLEVQKNEIRYENWCESILKDLFPGWKVRVDIQSHVNSVKMWVYLVDKTNII